MAWIRLERDPQLFCGLSKNGDVLARASVLGKTLVGDKIRVFARFASDEAN